MKSIVERTAAYVQKRLQDERSGHDWYHVYRVWKMAAYLQSKEGGDLELIELAALLHNAAEHDYRSASNEKSRPLALSGIIDVLEIDENLKPQIIAIVEASKFYGSATHAPITLESKVVQDANWLDSLGAIGIARNFTAGGYIGRKIYYPTSKSEFVAGQRKKKVVSSIEYFYQKALVVPSLLNTATAKAIAVKRVEFIKQYLNTFMEEWEMRDYK